MSNKNSKTTQVFNNESQKWEDCVLSSDWKYVEELDFIPRIGQEGRLNTKSRPAYISEDGKYVADENHSYFEVGDMIEDNMIGNNMGLGFVIQKEYFNASIPYTYTDKVDNKKKTAERPICSWKYLVEFPNPSKKGIARKGELWLWEFPMRELVDDGSFIVHKVKKGEHP